MNECMGIHFESLFLPFILIHTFIFSCEQGCTLSTWLSLHGILLKRKKKEESIEMQSEAVFIT